MRSVPLYSYAMYNGIQRGEAMTTTTKAPAPEGVIDFAEWDRWRATGWTTGEITAHNTAIVKAREVAREPVRPEYHTWTGRGGQVRHYVDNTAEICGRTSRSTWVDGGGVLHTDIALARAVEALTAATAAHAPTARPALRRMGDVEVQEYVAWIMDTEAQ